MEDSYTKKIIECLSLINDDAFKERILKLCQLYSTLEIGLKMIPEVVEVYNILITQEMNTMKDIESICSKILFVTEKIKIDDCPGCANCALDKNAHINNVFH